MSRPQNPARGAKRQPVNKSAVRRAMKETQAREHDNPLAPEVEKYLASYVPVDLDEDQWLTLRPVWAAILRYSNLRGLQTLKKYGRALSIYMVWRHRRGHTVVVRDMLTMGAVTAWFREVMDGSGTIATKTAIDYRTRLTHLINAVNPSPDSIRVATAGPRRLEPPYTEVELATIVRIASRQRSTKVRRHLCLVVGVGAGAGLDSRDIRHLRVGDIDDLGDDGIRIAVPGERPRLVMVRHEFEHLVRIGIEGLAPSRLVLGTNADRKAVVSKVIEQAELSPECPPIRAPRLRTTWIAWLLTQRIPISVVLQATGLTSASTLTEIARFLPPVDTDTINDFLRHPEGWS